MQVDVKKSTATNLAVGPFLAPSDGRTLITTATGITETDWELIVIPPGAAAATVKTIIASGVPGATERVLANVEDGVWRLELSSDDVGTVGNTTFILHDPVGGGALPIYINARVWPANEYAGIYAATEVWSPIATLQNRLSAGFGVASPDRLVDHLSALALVATTAPTAWASASYDVTTDSLLAQALLGASHTTQMNNLQASFDTSVAPVIVGSTALSGAGFLSDVVTKVRQMTDEPAVTPKYTDGDLLDYMQSAFGILTAEINASTDHAVLCRYDLQLVGGTLDYLLPPPVSSVWQVAKMDANGYVEWEAAPGSERSTTGRGYTLEGSFLRLLTDWRSSDVLRILFTPNAAASLCAGTAVSDEDSDDFYDGGSTFVLSTVEDGSADLRDDAYVGYILRITGLDATASPNWATERVVTGYVAATQTCTVNIPWVFDYATFGDTAWKWELLPAYSYLLKDVIALQTALSILANEGNEEKMKTLISRLQVLMRPFRMEGARRNARHPHSMDRDVPENSQLDRGWIL